MTKPELLRALQTEIHRHTFDYVVETLSVTQGGKGVAEARLDCDNSSVLPRIIPINSVRVGRLASAQKQSAAGFGFPDGFYDEQGSAC